MVSSRLHDDEAETVDNHWLATANPQLAAPFGQLQEDTSLQGLAACDALAAKSKGKCSRKSCSTPGPRHHQAICYPEGQTVITSSSVCRSQSGNCC